MTTKQKAIYLRKQARKARAKGDVKGLEAILFALLVLKARPEDVRIRPNH